MVSAARFDSEAESVSIVSTALTVRPGSLCSLRFPRNAASALSAIFDAEVASLAMKGALSVGSGHCREVNFTFTAKALPADQLPLGPPALVCMSTEKSESMLP